MNDYELMAELLLPSIDKKPEYYENLYPARNLAEGARVTRIAPSPTGYLHLGTLFAALVNRITATSTNGIFYTRIEDTDKKREIEGGIEDIIDGLNRFGITIDEGFVSGNEQKGDYGPYQQSQRAEIYQTYVKELIKQGLAYPCFCTAEELEAVRNKQEAEKIRTGYHGEWAKHRNITFEEAKTLVEEGKPFVIRLKSPGNEENKIVFPWCIAGEATKAEGIVEFSVRFYEIDIDNRCFSYNLNTQPAKSKILHGMKSTIPEEYCSLDAQFEQEVLDRLSRVERSYNLFWLDVERLTSEGGE